MPGEGNQLLDKLEREFEEIDSRPSGWATLFHSIGLESRNPDLTSKESLKPCNRPLNRYRNVSPYDHSRVVLLDSEVDYINANLVRVPIVGRRYVLSQGPLENTCGHFWLMIWQQQTRGVIMLNRIVENDVPKCHQYWPEKVGDTSVYDDVGLRVTLLRERGEGFYIIRTLRVTKESTGDSRDVSQFHYTTWPDFQVPASPAAFLSFLAAVRSTGALENDVGPSVIHCSAGIGRSGTFCLIDSCLLLVEKGVVSELDIRCILLELRTYRMGLIQTADQLRFCFLGIIRGARKILCESGTFDGNFDDVEEDTRNQPGSNHIDSSSEEDEGRPPTPPPRSDSLTRSFDNSSSSPPTVDDSSDGSGDELPAATTTTTTIAAAPVPEAAATEAEIRRREREGRKRATEDLITSIKSKQKAAEERSRRNANIREILPKFFVGAAIVAIVSVFSYKYWT